MKVTALNQSNLELSKTMTELNSKVSQCESKNKEMSDVITSLRLEKHSLATENSNIIEDNITLRLRETELRDELKNKTDLYESLSLTKDEIVIENEGLKKEMEILFAQYEVMKNDCEGNKVYIYFIIIIFVVTSFIFGVRHPISVTNLTLQFVIISL